MNRQKLIVSKIHSHPHQFAHSTARLSSERCRVWNHSNLNWLHIGPTSLYLFGFGFCLHSLFSSALVNFCKKILSAIISVCSLLCDATFLFYQIIFYGFGTEFSFCMLLCSHFHPLSCCSCFLTLSSFSVEKHSSWDSSTSELYLNIVVSNILLNLFHVYLIWPSIGTFFKICK